MTNVRRSEGNLIAYVPADDKSRYVAFYEKEYNSDIKGMGATRAALGRILRSIDLVGWSKHEESGRLDRKALTRFATGDVNVFARRDSKMADKSAVSIMVDCSGSMRGETIATASKVSIQLAKLLEQARVNYSITGFTGSEPDDCYNSETGTYVEEVEFIPFKERGESLRSAAPKMGAMVRMALTGNPDYSSLMFALEEIKAQKESRKIVFFLTDTGSYEPDQMAQVNRVADSFGITIIAIGIGTHGIGELFKHSVDIGNVEDMGTGTFSTMLRTLKSKD